MGTDRKVRLVATESQFYGTRQLRPGDKYEPSEGDAEDMLALGIARKDDEIVTQIAPRETKPLSVKQASKKQTANPLKQKRKYVKSGLYKRRDMRAED